MATPATVGVNVNVNCCHVSADADKADDYDKMRSMMTDSTTFTGGNGITRSVDEWLELKKSLRERFDSI